MKTTGARKRVFIFGSESHLWSPRRCCWRQTLSSRGSRWMWIYYLNGKWSYLYSHSVWQNKKPLSLKWTNLIWIWFFPEYIDFDLILKMINLNTFFIPLPRPNFNLFICTLWGPLRMGKNGERIWECTDLILLLFVCYHGSHCRCWCCPRGRHCSLDTWLSSM